MNVESPPIDAIVAFGRSGLVYIDLFLELKSSSTEVDRLLHWMTATMALEENVHLGAPSFAKVAAMVVSLLGIQPPSPAKG